MKKLISVRDIPAYAVIIRAEWERGETQREAVDELCRRGLWLADDQLAHAKLIKIDHAPWYQQKFDHEWYNMLAPRYGK